MLFDSLKSCLDELVDLAGQLTLPEYNSPCPELNGATVGQHYRHIIEFFLCLIHSYETGKVNYDSRQRNRHIETEIPVALEYIKNIGNTIRRTNKPLLLEQTFHTHHICIQSNYFRELLYNLEHTIHHQALIRVAVLKFDRIRISDTFGMAPSTVEYRKKQCAQ
ncbi:DinB family protein [Sinomicrobium pectinilyticum]|uniref:DinB family protein n=1 Tax=Sinomicrobium pectinilyticum TaxID=1084421 RepID=A0A3N0F019_SINP1|nr:DinB family protein [Sinomicrobium pectinilyticum]RNL93518.1 DinB family protein [Sinomicrobium pectinilyticum]